jgi:NAD(P)H-flavin reductase
MLQMIVAVLANPADKTKIKFLFANKSEKDILLRYTLDRLQREHPNRFSVHYTISKAGDSWKGSTGRVSKDMIAKHCFAAEVGGYAFLSDENSLDVFTGVQLLHSVDP